MQFVRNGPDIPEELLQAHEDGRVVFFCTPAVLCRARGPEFNTVPGRRPLATNRRRAAGPWRQIARVSMATIQAGGTVDEKTKPQSTGGVQ